VRRVRLQSPEKPSVPASPFGFGGRNEREQFPPAGSLISEAPLVALQLAAEKVKIAGQERPGIKSIGFRFCPQLPGSQSGEVIDLADLPCDDIRVIRWNYLTKTPTTMIARLQEFRLVTEC
jgi:hypothetical protein